jgi:hypothetical protein
MTPTSPCPFPCTIFLVVREFFHAARAEMVAGMAATRATATASDITDQG